MEVAVHAFKAAKTFHDTGACRAKELPVHPEKADRRGMKEEIDRFDLCNVFLGGEAQRIDAKKGIVATGPNVAFKLRNNAR